MIRVAILSLEQNSLVHFLSCWCSKNRNNFFFLNFLTEKFTKGRAQTLKKSCFTDWTCPLTAAGSERRAACRQSPPCAPWHSPAGRGRPPDAGSVHHQTTPGTSSRWALCIARSTAPGRQDKGQRLLLSWFYFSVVGLQESAAGRSCFNQRPLNLCHLLTCCFYLLKYEIKYFTGLPSMDQWSIISLH